MSIAEKWLARIAITKVLKRLIQLGIAYLAGQNLDHVGITINPDVATGAAYGALELLRNWLKVKKGLSFL